MTALYPLVVVLLLWANVGAGWRIVRGPRHHAPLPPDVHGPSLGGIVDTIAVEPDSVSGDSVWWPRSVPIVVNGRWLSDADSLVIAWVVPMRDSTRKEKP